MCTLQQQLVSFRRLVFWAALIVLVVGPAVPSFGYRKFHDEGTDRLQPWDNCVMCHGDDLMGNLGPACTTCHNDFSAPDLPPTGHHKSGRDDPLTNCVLCHGDDLTGNPSFGTPSCFSCHDQLWSGGGTVNSPPVINAGGPYAGTVGVAVQFDASGTTDADGDPLTFLWDFGDGSFPSGGSSAVVSHVYDAADTYTVTLAVADGKGLPVSTQFDVEITQTNSPPTASAGGPYAGTANQAVQLDASGSTDPDGDTLTFTWDFGDGSPVEGPSNNAITNHTYQTAGTYLATVTVSDGANDPVTSEANVDVAADGGGGGGGGGTPPPTGNGWDVQFPWLGIGGTVEFDDFGPWLLVQETIDNGPAIQGIGFRVDSSIVWLDAGGSLFIGSQSAAGDSMWGLVFNLTAGNTNSVWFASPQTPPPALDLGGLGDLLGGTGLPDLGSLGLGGTGSGSTPTGSTGGGSTPTPATGTGGTSGGTSSGSAAPPTRPRAYDVYRQRGDSYAPSFAPTRSQ